jgi:hypothetical protein
MRRQKASSGVPREGPAFNSSVVCMTARCHRRQALTPVRQCGQAGLTPGLRDYLAWSFFLAASMAGARDPRICANAADLVARASARHCERSLRDMVEQDFMAARYSRVTSARVLPLPMLEAGAEDAAGGCGKGWSLFPRGCVVCAVAATQNDRAIAAAITLAVKLFMTVPLLQMTVSPGLAAICHDRRLRPQTVQSDQSTHKPIGGPCRPPCVGARIIATCNSSAVGFRRP